MRKIRKEVLQYANEIFQWVTEIFDDFSYVKMRI